VEAEEAVIRRMTVVPEMFLYLRHGARLEVIAEAVPQDAKIIGRGLTEWGDFYLDIDHWAFADASPLTPGFQQIPAPAPIIRSLLATYDRIEELKTDGQEIEDRLILLNPLIEEFKAKLEGLRASIGEGS
jgi:hypothetical protein